MLAGSPRKRTSHPCMATTDLPLALACSASAPWTAPIAPAPRKSLAARDWCASVFEDALFYVPSMIEPSAVRARASTFELFTEREAAGGGGRETEGEREGDGGGEGGRRRGRGRETEGDGGGEGGRRRGRGKGRGRGEVGGKGRPKGKPPLSPKSERRKLQTLATMPTLPLDSASVSSRRLSAVAHQSRRWLHLSYQAILGSCFQVETTEKTKQFKHQPKHHGISRFKGSNNLETPFGATDPWPTSPDNRNASPKVEISRQFGT